MTILVAYPRSLRPLKECLLIRAFNSLLQLQYTAPVQPRSRKIRRALEVQRTNERNRSLYRDTPMVRGCGCSARSSGRSIQVLPRRARQGDGYADGPRGYRPRNMRRRRRRRPQRRLGRGVQRGCSVLYSSTDRSTVQPNPSRGRKQGLPVQQHKLHFFTFAACRSPARSPSTPALASNPSSWCAVATVAASCARNNNEFPACLHRGDSVTCGPGPTMDVMQTAVRTRGGTARCARSPVTSFTIQGPVSRPASQQASRQVVSDAGG